MEIEKFPQPSLRYITSLVNCLITWIKKISVIVLLDMSKVKLRKAGVSESACA